MLLKHLASLSATVLAAQAAILHKHARRQTNSTTEYDYVVVGSGAGGGPLASRLALGGFKVLLIEAGDDQGDSDNYRVPAWQLNAQEDPNMKWDFYVKHYANETRQKKDSKMVYTQTNGSLYWGTDPPAGATPKGILYPRSGTLGGCAAHNALVTVYPFESDWTYIQTLTGDSSWSPSNMRTYFEKLERSTYLPNSVAGHGFNGWLPTTLTPVSLIVEDSNLQSIIIGAAAAMGKGLLTSLVSTVTGLTHILLGDLNAPGTERDATQSLWQVPLAMDNVNYSRASPREFILDTANAVNSDGSRKYHLDIQLYTLATKIRFDNSSTPVAIGVEYLQGKSLYAADPRYAGDAGTPGYVAAKKEVIIAAGAYNTPQLLKLSGVGPRAELESFNIPVVVDLPGVGTNLQDRYEIGVVAESHANFTVEDGCTFGFSYPDPCLEAWKTGLTGANKGVYATSGVAVVVSVKSSQATKSEDPDLLILGVPGDFRGYRPDYAYDSISTHNKWSWESLKAHSHNTAGTVTLRSADPRDTPEIIFRSFDEGTTANGADSKDLQASYEGIKLVREMFQKTLSGSHKFTEIWPQPKGAKNYTTEAQVKDYIKQEAWGHHASCSSPIGADGDSMAVLDSSFRVRGVKGLRVVDASVFPKIPGTFPVLSVYIIAEKAADVIIKGN